ncbi:MAG: sugar ABC transporter permease [Oscillospiraceae bacterium]|jgi:ABC-type sugar transport system permease subunit|nr:sugar ABC transporter permease [Oscillospiraceae bacterium]
MTGVVKKRRGMTLSQRRAVTGLLFISPFVLGFLLFYVRSLWMVGQFAFSETTTEGLGYTTRFIGLENFRYAFTGHPRFTQILTESLINMVVDVPLIIFFSLFIAIVLNQKFRGRTVARAIFFLPALLNAPAIVQALDLVRAMMIGGSSPAPSAVVDSVSGAGGGSAGILYYIDLLGDIALPETVLEYIVGAVSRINTVITMSGVQIIIFLAALQSISPSLYEVAKIEGATTYETFWKITFPMVSPLLVTNMVYTVLDSFVNSRVLQEVYDTMFGEQNYSVGAAFSLISMISVCGILGIASYAVSKLVYYDN